MFTLKQLITLALAGTAIAAPLAHRSADNEGPRGRLRGNQGYYKQISDEIVQVTPTDTADNAVVTVYAIGNGRGGRQQQSSNDDDDNESQSAPSTGSDSGSDTGSDTSSGSSKGGYIDIVNKYRTAGGLPSLKVSSKLEANALKTAKDGNGSMKHQLNPGSMGQVLAPGGFSKFESIYVGGWLCEIPGLKGLNGACNKMTAGWDHSNGDTGHAKILTSTSYTAIGCGSDERIMACDLGSS